MTAMISRFLVLMTLVLAACGTEASPTGPTSAPDVTADPAPATTAAAPTSIETTTPAETSTNSGGAYPVEVETAVGPVTVESRPERIVSLSPTATEILFAIGAGDQVLAVDSLSDFPSGAPTTEFSAYEPNTEAIIELDPDLVVITFDPGDLSDGLAAAQIPVITQFTAVSLEDAFDQFEQLGIATGHADDAADVVAEIEAAIEEIVAQTPVREVPLTYYHELDATFYSVTSSTFVGELYGLVGLENVADPADDGSAFGYPQLSAEYLVETDPDLIFLADTKCCAVTAESLAERPGWATLSAVQQGHVVELDDDVASRWGPRIVDFLRTISQAVVSLEAGG